MAKNNLSTEIRTKLDTFVSELSDMIRMAALGSVSMALGADAGTAPRRGRPPGKRGPGRPKGSANAAPAAKARRGKRAKRSTADVEAVGEQVLSHVRANPGQNIGQISAGLGAPSKGLQLPVQRLISVGLLRTEGQRRGTKYFAGGGGGRKAKGARRGKRRTKKA